MALLVFAVTLVLAVLVSGFAQRSIVSTAVLFFAAGFLAGDETLGLLKFDQNVAAVARLAEIALFGVLFVDGMKISVRDLRVGWHLPLRALLLGMPITLMVTAVLARMSRACPGMRRSSSAPSSARPTRCWCPRSSAAKKFRSNSATY